MREVCKPYQQTLDSRESFERAREVSPLPAVDAGEDKEKKTTIATPRTPVSNVGRFCISVTFQILFSK